MAATEARWSQRFRLELCHLVIGHDGNSITAFMASRFYHLNVVVTCLYHFFFFSLLDSFLGLVSRNPIDMFQVLEDPLLFDHLRVMLIFLFLMPLAHRLLNKFLLLLHPWLFITFEYHLRLFFIDHLDLIRRCLSSLRIQDPWLK